MVLPPIVIRSLKIDPPLLLAPMAGLTHSALRRLVIGFGGMGLLSTEMLAAVRLPSENPLLSPYLVRTPQESPMSYQMLLAREQDVVPAVEALQRFGADAIDLNLGCPAPMVRRVGAGSRLAENPALVRQLVGLVRRQTGIPLTAKIRLGASLDESGLRDFCKMLEGEGVDMITVHARLRDEPFVRRPRWEWVAKVKTWVGVPVVANGGIFSVADAAKCLMESGADGLMIGRAAAVKPWLFSEVARDMLRLDIPKVEISLPDIYNSFASFLCENFAPERRLGRLKEFTHYFSQNYLFGHRLASTVQASRDFDQAMARAAIFLARNVPRAADSDNSPSCTSVDVKDEHASETHSP